MDLEEKEKKHTILKQIDKYHFDKKQLEEAGKMIKNGGLVAFPTETVYGLGGNALDEEAAKKIYRAKGRPSDNPLIVHIADISALDELAVDIPENAKKLAEAFWPGPLTMILKKSAIVPKGTTGGLDSVAIRMPNHPIALELIRQSGCYIAAPSANTSGRPSPTMAKHVEEDLLGKIDYIIDGGDVSVGIESTIVDLTGDTVIILRPGVITKENIEKMIGDVEYDPAIMQKENVEGMVAKAPGMKYKHYAPKGKLTIIKGEIENVIRVINEQSIKKEKEGHLTGVIATEETKDSYLMGVVKSIGSRKEEETIAANLYKILREFDEIGTEYIYSESFEKGDLGQAIMNRLLKAAGYDILEV